MKQVIVGSTVEFSKDVEPEDVASFEGEVVHQVYSTFALARDAEWTTRQFVLALRDVDEEGIGTQLTVEHKSPAFVGNVVTFRARIEALKGNELICSYEAWVGERLIASGTTRQKILKRDRIVEIFNEKKVL